VRDRGSSRQKIETEPLCSSSIFTIAPCHQQTFSSVRGRKRVGHGWLREVRLRDDQGELLQASGWLAMIHTFLSIGTMYIPPPPQTRTYPKRPTEINLRFNTIDMAVKHRGGRLPETLVQTPSSFAVTPVIFRSHTSTDRLETPNP